MDLTAALLLAAAVFLLGILIGLLSGMRVASRRQTDASPGRFADSGNSSAKANASGLQ
jgi:hypothetical protein